MNFMIETNNIEIDFENLEIAYSAKSNRDLKRANRIFSMMNYPILTSSGKAITKISLKLGLPVSNIIRKTVFNHFCGGISINDCKKTIEELNQFSIGTILDFSAEGEDNEEGFENTKREILKTIDAASKEKGIPYCVFKMSGMAPSALLEKIGAGLTLTAKEEELFRQVKNRVLEVCSTASANKVPIMFDAEESWIQEPIDEMCYEMMRKFNSERVVIYNTYQMYRKDALKRLSTSFEALRAEGVKFGAKLVRGAYMEKERERAEEFSYEDPIHPTKADTDACFDKGLEYCASHYKDLAVMCGSHNEESNKYLAELMAQQEIPNSHPHFWFAQLYGMSDNISFNLAGNGYNVAKYVPYGPVKSVMPYLFRRAEENTSVAGQSSRELKMIRKELARRAKSR